MSFNYLQQKRKADIIFTNSIGQTTILNTAQLTKENCLAMQKIDLNVPFNAFSKIIFA